MPLPVIDPVRKWGCLQTDWTIAGQAISGGASLSGIDEPIRTDGGGYIQGTLSQGTALTPAQNKAWRAFTTYLDGGVAQFICIVGERRHQPVKARAPWSNPSDSVYASGGAIAHVQTVQNGQTGGLRATKMRITTQLEVPLEGGEWFTIVHTTWGERAYNMVSATLVSTGVYDIEFRPPLREATASDGSVFVDFDNPRCIMNAKASSNQFNWPNTGVIALNCAEDMRKP